MRLSTEIEIVFAAQQQHSLIMRESTLNDRLKWMALIADWVFKNRSEIHRALYTDLGKPAQEADMTEIYPVLSEIKKVKHNLKSWMRADSRRGSIAYIGTKAAVFHEPKGVCLVISPWNYPFMLTLSPLISAIAAGNTIIVKPSEYAPNTSRLIGQMTKQLFQEHHLVTLEGDVEISKQLLSLPFNHIFFTGSPQVGKIVMEHAAKHLASVTLELGGKSPVIVDETAEVKDAARKIAWGKWVNAGQTCVAPDYIFVHNEIRKDFIKELAIQANLLYGDKSNYTSIVNEKHFQRVENLKLDALKKGAKMLSEGRSDLASLRLDPQIMTDVPEDALLMNEEIFGPIVAIKGFDQLSEAIDFINANEKPLALYHFSNNAKNKKRILYETSSGSLVYNDCVLQVAHPSLPFGGVNNSGFGKSHGKYGFLAFSNQKAVLKQRVGLTMSGLLYPPYGSLKNKLIELLLKYF
jgi:aldehyde dehydrogenase (NAD+)